MNKDCDEFDMWCKNRLTKNDIYSAIFEGMTNGEVIKTVFPDADIEYRKISVYVTISPLTNLVIFDKDWWNSSYKGE